MKTYTLTAVDYVGCRYNVGFILAESLEEARKRARQDFGAQADAKEGGQAINVIDDLILAENELTSAKMRPFKKAVA